MSSSPSYDVIIVGSGAGGGTLARHLAPSGKRILILERGDFLPQEPKNWDSHAVMRDCRYRCDTWLDRNGKPFDPHMYYFVGGNTKVFGCVLYRLRREDFGELIHHGGISPAWPISYEDLEPYYGKAEAWYQVHGRHGMDPTDPPTSKHLPFKPVSHEPIIQQLSDGLTAAGYHPAPLPLGIMLDEDRPGNSPCIRCKTCDGFPCFKHAKCDAEVLGVRPAIAYPNVTLLTNAEVIRLETSPTGREVTRVIARLGDGEKSFQGNFIVLAAGAANTARLLLMSHNQRHPNGLANGSGQVGRNYMCHNLTMMVKFLPRENSVVFQKTLALNDFYFGSDDFHFPMGNVQMVGKTSGDHYRNEVSKLVPDWLLDRASQNSVDFFLMTEDLPNPKNRITLTDKGQIRLHYRPNNMEGMRQLKRRWKNILGKISGFQWGLCINHPISARGLGHQTGTCRFGLDPKDSVLNRDCRAHELDNLYIVDASIFPSSGAVNPALTIMANALRVGDHILQRF